MGFRQSIFNAIIYNDFEMFWGAGTNTNFFFKQIGLPNCALPPSVSPNSPDILYFFDTPDDRFVQLTYLADLIGDPIAQEFIYLPIRQGLAPGCSLELGFDACNITSHLGAGLTFYGSHDPTCSSSNINLGYKPIANSNATYAQVPCGSPLYPYGLSCHGTVLTVDNTPSIFHHYNISLVNTTNETLYYLKIEASPIPTESLVFLDNLSISYNCSEEVTITATPGILGDICPNGVVEIEYEFCHTGGASSSLPIEVNFNISPTSGLNIIGGNPQMVTLGAPNSANDCQTLTVGFELVGPPPPNNQYSITIEPLANNTCFNGLRASDRILNVVNSCPIDCPCLDNGINIGAPGAKTHTAAHPEILNTYIDKCITISGTLILDKPGNFIFNNCDIRMQPGAEIIVEMGNFIIRNTSDLYGCEKMWNGITVSDGATLTIGESSTVKDAIKAIDAKAGSFVSLESSTFDRNKISLYSEEEFILIGLTNILFDCTSTLLPPYSGQYSQVGINVSNGNLLNIANSTFQNLNNGIITFKNSVNLLTGSTFNNIFLHGTSNFTPVGYAIRIDGDKIPSPYSLKQVGGIFTNCTTGIYGKAVSMEVSGTTMTGMTYGIVSDFGTQKIDVHGNTISCSETGIEVSQAGFFTSKAINGNTITLNGNGKGVFINKPSIGFLGMPGSVANNTIYMMGPSPIDGIALVDANKFNVFENTVYIQDGTTGGTGISTKGGGNNLAIKNNHVFGTNPHIGANTAIRAYSSPSAIWECNDVHNTFTGFRFDLPCNTSNGFRGNTMQNHSLGLNLKLDAKLGVQTRTANRWIG